MKDSVNIKISYLEGIMLGMALYQGYHFMSDVYEVGSALIGWSLK